LSRDFLSNSSTSSSNPTEELARPIRFPLPLLAGFLTGPFAQSLSLVCAKNLLDGTSTFAQLRNYQFLLSL